MRALGSARVTSALSRRLSTVSLRPFLVEQYEGWFDGSDSLSSSECEPLTLTTLLAMADATTRQRWDELSLGYPAFNTGSRDLREAISAQYDDISANDHINVCAPQEGISLAIRALLQPGDHVVATTPCYQSLTEVARSEGCPVVNWDPVLGGETTGGRAWFDPAELERLLVTSSQAHPIPPHPIQSHPIPSHPIPSHPSYPILSHPIPS